MEHVTCPELTDADVIEGLEEEVRQLEQRVQLARRAERSAGITFRAAQQVTCRLEDQYERTLERLLGCEVGEKVT